MNRRSFSLSLLGLMAGCGGDMAQEYTLVPSPVRRGYGLNTPIRSYQEFEWTPVLDFIGGVSGVTYSAQFGFGVKLGRLVQTTFRIVLTSKGAGSGTAFVSGLPIASRNDNSGATVGALKWANMTSALVCGYCVKTSNSNVINIAGATAATANLAALDFAVFSDTSDFTGTIAYLANE